MAEGYKAWTGGQVLEAEDLTDYASSQAVMRFANAAGRDAALTVSVVKEGMLAYLKDTNILTVNTDGTTTGWVQIYPVITAGITDNQVTNAKLAANAVSTTNIIDGTIVGGDIASATITGSNIAASTITSSNILDGTIVGNDIASGTITGANIQDGSIGPSDLAGGTYGISISGSAASASSATTATSAGYATNAGNADTLDGYNSSTTTAGDTVAVRYASGTLQGFNYVATGGSIFDFYGTGTYTYLGFGCGRVINSTDIYSQAVSGRTVLVSSGLTLGTSTSSRRHKRDITPLAYDTSDILKMEPVSYRYNEGHLEEGATYDIEVGLIAEDLADLGFEEVIFRDKNGEPDGIAYEKLSVLLLKVCQDQQTQLDALSARLDALEANGAN
jgi:hypothetical protein